MSVRTIIDNGPSKNRIDIVILGDGYTSSQTALFSSDAQKLTSYLFNNSTLTQPFGRYQDYFNVHLVDVVSAQSGADNPDTGKYVNTALNSSYFFDGKTERLLYIDSSRADLILNQALTGTSVDAAEMRFVTVNSTKYGGGGGSYAVYAGGNRDSLEVAVHEVGHSFARLADEYGGNPGRYNGPEPTEANVTTNPSGAKWSHWLGYDQPGIGVIGAYEGGKYYDQGVCRPSLNSKMRSLNQPFDAISREKFVLEFYKYVDPIDSYAYSGATAPLVDIKSLFVKPIDTDTIKVDWYVDGRKVKSNATNVTMDDLGLGKGTHTVTAKAYDDTDWVRGDRSSLEESVSWTVTLNQNAGIIKGTAFADTLTGTLGNDVFEGLAGNDTINGSAGTDTVLFSGNARSYSISLDRSGIVNVADRRGVDGIDKLSSIETAKFADTTVNIDILDGVTTLSAAELTKFIEMYIAYFNRAPDATGLYFWATKWSEGTPLRQIAASFFDQPETQARYPASLSTESFVKTVYNNVLGRDPESGGFSYWVNALNSGSVSKPVFMLAVIDGAKAPTSGPEDFAYITGKAKIGTYFAAIKGLSDGADANAVMQMYDGTNASMAAAKNAIDGYYNDATSASNGELTIALTGVIPDPFA